MKIPAAFTAFDLRLVSLRPNGLIIGVFTLLLTLFSTETVFAQQLGPGDVLSITVLTYPELGADTVMVSASGTINLPVAGQILVTGQTPISLSAAIARKLNKRIVNPEVTVALRAAASRQVFVLGGVARPGVYDVKPGWRVSELLAAAGGVPGRLDETKATLARPTQAPQPIDLTVAVGNPASLQNRTIRPGDVLVVTSLDPQYVTVSGDVVKPDIFPLRRARRLLDALVAAGGFKQPSTSSQGFLLRMGQRIPLDLSGAMQYTNFTANITLQPGDLIMVEAIAPVSITVNGLVRNPGNYSLQPGSGVLQAIAQAGGQTTTAERTVVTLLRGTTVLPVDVPRAALNPDADIRLQSGDLVQLSEPQIIRVQVTGQVRDPGERRLPPTATVLDAIAQAGGLGISPATARIRIIRDIADREKALEVNAASLMEGRDLSQNAHLQDGDVISVSNIEAQVVFVSGEISKPGAYDLKEGEGVAELIARAGGPTGQALLRSVQVERGGQTTTIDALSALKEGQDKPQYSLHEGDFVVVPQNTSRVLVMQEVNRPGYVSVPEDHELTIGEALSLAGGPRERAKLNEVIIFHRTPAGLTNRIVQLDKMQQNDLGVNEKLVAGDILYVPIGRPSRSRAAFDSIVSSVGTLRFLGVY